jgi:hypothetical protein
VYAAAPSDQQFRKVVAVKLIKSGMDFEEVLRRFPNERHILAASTVPTSSACSMVAARKPACLTW